MKTLCIIASKVPMTNKVDKRSNQRWLLKFLSVIVFTGFFNFANAQMTKSDVEAVFSGVDIKSKENFYVIFNQEYVGGQWVEKFEKLNPQTINVIPKEGGLLLKGSSYSYLIPYGSLKLIGIEKTFIKIQTLN